MKKVVVKNKDRSNEKIIEEFNKEIAELGFEEAKIDTINNTEMKKKITQCGINETRTQAPFENYSSNL